MLKFSNKSQLDLCSGRNYGIILTDILTFDIASALEQLKTHPLMIDPKRSSKSAILR